MHFHCKLCKCLVQCHSWSSCLYATCYFHLYRETRDEARGRGTCACTCRRTPQAYPAQGLSPAQSPGLPAAPLITNLPPWAPQHWAECCGEAPPCTQPLLVSVDSKLFFHSLFYLLFLAGGLGDSGDTQRFPPASQSAGISAELIKVECGTLVWSERGFTASSLDTHMWHLLSHFYNLTYKMKL